MPRPRSKKGTDLDFSGWKYERILFLKPSEKVFEAYPEFQLYPEMDQKNFKGLKLSFEKVLKYIILYYSPNILRDAFPDIASRKREAALIAGFVINKQTHRFATNVEELLSCENIKANRIIIRFLRRAENKKFAQLCVFEEAKAKQMQKLLDGVGDKDKELTKVVIENVKSLNQDIEDLEKDILNEDKSPPLVDLLYNEVDYSNLGISPEEVAQATRDGDLEYIFKIPYIHIKDSQKYKKNKVVVDESE